MRNIILGSLSALVLSTAIAPVVRAEMTPMTSPMAVTPFNLVFLAYQGFLEPEGIPSFARLISGHTRGRITAEDLVRGAIDMNRLPEETLTDSDYLSAVEWQLNALRQERSR